MRRYVAFAELPEREVLVGKRVRMARRRYRLSQKTLATWVGLTRDQLNNVELGRVALRFHPGWNICLHLDLNPLWLSGDEEEMAGFVDLGSFEEISDDDLFTPIVDDLNSLGGMGESSYSEIRKDHLTSVARSKARATYDSVIGSYEQRVRPRERDSFWNFIAAAARDFVSGAKGAEYFANEAVQPSEYADKSVKAGKKRVALYATPSSLRGVTSNIGTWRGLRNQLRKHTAAPGAKAAFARAFGVSIQVLSQWLSGASAPKADTALRLRKHLSDADEADKQQKSAGTAETAPAPKTQKSKSTSHEKAKSDRKKK